MLHSVRLQLVDKIRWPSVQFNNYHPFTYRTTTFVRLISWLVLYQASNITQSSTTYSTFHMTIQYTHLVSPPCVSKNLLPFPNSASHITTFHTKKARTSRPLKHFYCSTKAAEIGTFFKLHEMADMKRMRGWSIRHWHLGFFKAKTWPEWLNETMLSSEPDATI